MCQLSHDYNCDSTTIRLRSDYDVIGYKPISQLRFDYDMTTIRLYRDEFDYDGSDRNYDMRSIRLRYDYDPTTTYRARLLPFDAIPRYQKMNVIFRRSPVVVVSQSNRTQIVISITFVVVECVVVSSYRSRIVVESQL